VEDPNSTLMPDLRAKPRNRLERLRRRIEDVRERRFPYEPRERKRIDWTRYTDAQIYENHDTIRLLVRLVDFGAEPPPRSGPGRRSMCSARDRAKVLLLQQYFGVSNRRAHGFAVLFQEKLRLEQVPKYKSIERAYGDPRVWQVLNDAFERSARLAAPGVEAFTLDGSGLPTRIKQNWERDKRGKGAA
jgi:hypothetical protein